MKMATKTLNDFKNELCKEEGYYTDFDSVGTPEAALRITDLAAERYAAYREQQVIELKDIAVYALRVQKRDIKQYEAYSKELELLLTEDQYEEAYSRALEKVPDLPVLEIPCIVQQAKHVGFIEGAKAQRIICAGAARTGDGSYYHIAHDSILNAPLATNPYKQKEEQ